MASISAAPMVVAWVCLALALILVGARMYTRGMVTRSFGPEDPLMVVSALGALAHQVGIILQTQQGLGGVPKTDADGADSALAKWLLATIFAYQATHLFLSLSIAYQYQKTITLPLARIISFFLVGWLGVSGAVGVGLVPLHCTPVQDFWRYDQGNESGCRQYSVISFALASLNMANDLFLWGFLLPFSFQLRMSVGLCGVLILGFGSVFCSALRISAAAQISSPSATALASSQAVIFAVSGSLELSLAIIAACLATLEPLWPHAARIFHRRSSPIAARGNSSLPGYRHQAQGSQSGESVLLDELTPAGRVRSQPGNNSPGPHSREREQSPIANHQPPPNRLGYPPAVHLPHDQLLPHCSRSLPSQAPPRRE